MKCSVTITYKDGDVLQYHHLSLKVALSTVRQFSPQIAVAAPGMFPVVAIAMEVEA